MRYIVETIQYFGPNVFGFQPVTGERRWYIIRCYVAPDDTSMIESVFSALKERPWVLELLVTGYLNSNLEQSEVYQIE